MSWTRELLAEKSDDDVAAIFDRVANRLTKWRSVFAGWQLGTRRKTDPTSQAVRDHREATIMLRAEVNALSKVLIDAGVFTAREFTEQAIVEVEALDAAYAARFPGITSTDEGMSYKLPESAETMKWWLP